MHIDPIENNTTRSLKKDKMTEDNGEMSDGDEE